MHIFEGKQQELLDRLQERLQDRPQELQVDKQLDRLEKILFLHRLPFHVENRRKYLLGATPRLNHGPTRTPTPPNGPTPTPTGPTLTATCLIARFPLSLFPLSNATISGWIAFSLECNSFIGTA